MPGETRVLGEHRPGAGGQREPRPQLAVERILRRREQREGIRASVEEDGDEHLLLRGCRRSCGDALVEHPRTQRRAAVDRECEAEAARHERAPVETCSRRHRHPGLDRGQPPSGFGEAAPQQL